ncbi:MAG: ATP-binding protein [Lachnospiraceae bacterium]
MTIILGALLTVFALMLLVRLPENAEDTAVYEQNGVYDLRKAIDSDTSAIRLIPGNTYYPNTYLTPGSVDTAAAESTGRLEEIRADYLSQRFTLLLPDHAVYTLSFRLSGRHAMRVYVNGELSGEAGRLGTTKQDTEVWENNITVNASPKNGKMDIILHSAQFYHVKRGASLAELHLYRQGAGTDPQESNRIKGLLVMGALSSAAVSLFGIYLLLARTQATLYFALACAAMTLRECVQSQVWTVFPISGGSSFMLEYLSVVLLTIFLSLYLGQYATGRFLKIVQETALVGSAVYGLCILLGDSIFYTGILKYYQFLLLLCMTSSAAGLFWKLRRPNREQAAALYGIAVFFLSGAADIVMYLDILIDTDINLPVSEATMLIFALAQTLSLYLMNNRVLNETKEAEQRLAAEKTAVEYLDRMKTEFLSNVAHELKTPLTVVSGHAQLIRSQLEDSAYPSARDKARIISSEADRLSLMVGQVLDVTRIEEGKMHLDKCLCHMDELIYKAVETHFPILNKGGNRLEIKVSLDLPMVKADPERIMQVLVNLIANALSHTEHGVILVSSWESENYLAVSVADTGTGMTLEEQAHLFTRFQSRKPDSRKTGTGLGLYICKYLVEEHGGSIRVESAESHGTTVTFFLPM